MASKNPNFYPGVILCMSSLALLLLVCISSSSSSPTPSNSRPTVYMGAFYDPKYHDDGRDSQKTQRTPAIVDVLKPSRNQYFKIFKRGAILPKTSRRQLEDQIAQESYSNSQQKVVVERVPVREVQTYVQPQPQTQPQKQNQKVRDQLQVESGKALIVQSQAQSQNQNQNAHQQQPQPQHEARMGAQDFYNYKQIANGPRELENVVEWFKDDLKHGRRKFKSYYLKPNYKHSPMSLFGEMESHIGYW